MNIFQDAFTENLMITIFSWILIISYTLTMSKGQYYNVVFNKSKYQNRN